MSRAEERYANELPKWRHRFAPDPTVPSRQQYYFFDYPSKRGHDDSSGGDVRLGNRRSDTDPNINPNNPFICPLPHMVPTAYLGLSVLSGPSSHTNDRHPVFGSSPMAAHR